METTKTVADADEEWARDHPREVGYLYSATGSAPKETTLTEAQAYCGIAREALVRELAWIICAHHGDHADFGAPGVCRQCTGPGVCLFLSERAAAAVLDKLNERGMVR